MPELPEVETIVRELSASQLAGKVITHVDVFWERSLGGMAKQEFLASLKGQKIRQILRQGKWLVFVLSKGFLYVHLRMTGKFFFGKPDEPIHFHERIRVFLDDGSILRFEDQRKFGRWQFTSSMELAPSVGVDPFSRAYTYCFFANLLKSHSQAIKPFLLDQKHLAGLGNIYVDEALWEARIHPLQRTNHLSEKQAKALFAAIPNVLQKGIDNTGTTLGNTRANYFSVSGRKGSNQHQLNVFRREGEPCPRCSTIICKIKVAQRGTHYCPKCQQND